MADAPETLEALQARHRKEQRDLVSRITQKKKQATKKTRKGVNDECERLERELKERQAHELAVHSGEVQSEAEEEPVEDTLEDDVEQKVQSLSITETNGDEGVNGGGKTAEAPKKKPNRAKARLARRAAEQDALAAQAAEEAANMPNLRDLERQRMDTQLARHNLFCKEIRADGHCLYAAVADQMQAQELGLKPRIDIKTDKMEDYKVVRYAAAGWIESNPDDFVGFMEEPLDTYLSKIRESGEWGGHMELMALAKTYNITINVLHGDGRVDNITPGEGEKGEGKEIWLGYYRHSHGLGEHYNSLRQKPTP